MTKMNLFQEAMHATDVKQFVGIFYIRRKINAIEINCECDFKCFIADIFLIYNIFCRMVLSLFLSLVDK